MENHIAKAREFSFSFEFMGEKFIIPWRGKLTIFCDELQDVIRYKALTSILEETRGNLAHSARLLGLERAWLQKLMKFYGITAQKYRGGPDAGIPTH